LQVGPAILGAISSAYFYSYAIAQIPAGAMLDRAGVKKTLIVFSLVACLGTLLFSQGQDALQVTMGRALVGFGVGAFFLSCLKVAALWFEPREFGFMLGVTTSIGSLGSIAATAPLAVMTLLIGWRGSFLTVLVFMLALTAYSYLVLPHIPPQVHNRSFTQEPLSSQLKKVFTHKEFLILFPIPFLSYGAMMAFHGLWGGPFLMQVYGLDKTTAGSILLMVSVGFLSSAMLIGWLSDKVLKSRRRVIIAGEAILLFFWFSVVFFTSFLPFWSFYALCFLLGMGFAAADLYMAMAKEMFPVEMSGLTTASLNLSNFIGVAFFQVVLGFMLRNAAEASAASAYSGVFMLCLAAVVLSLILALFTKETLK